MLADIHYSQINKAMQILNASLCCNDYALYMTCRDRKQIELEVVFTAQFLFKLFDIKVLAYEQSFLHCVSSIMKKTIGRESQALD